MDERDTYLRPVDRDLRLDLFRGAGLWMIFVDHIPDFAFPFLTLRNYGFSDAAEMFVFISGYLVGFIHAPIVTGGHFLASLKRLWKRAGQLYVAHILLFLLFTAQVARTARRFDNPMYQNEFNVFSFLREPDILIGHAITLRYRPVNLDILPLYIVLVLASPLIVWCLVRRPNVTMLASLILYVAARWFEWNLPSFPAGKFWYFNPFCWQLLFVFGAWCGAGQIAKVSRIVWSRAGLTLAATWLLFAFFVVMTWQSPSLYALVPRWMANAMYPIDKTDLDMLRLTHFLALALVASFLIKRDWKALNSAWLRPLILCGRHSLAIFCYSILLSFSAHWILTQYGNGSWHQIAVCSAGILILVGAAWLLDRASRIPDLFVDELVFRKPPDRAEAEPPGSGMPRN